MLLVASNLHPYVEYNLISARFTLAMLHRRSSKKLVGTGALPEYLGPVTELQPLAAGTWIISEMKVFAPINHNLARHESDCTQPDLPLMANWWEADRQMPTGDLVKLVQHACFPYAKTGLIKGNERLV